jgi:hypothetical protein
MSKTSLCSPTALAENGTRLFLCPRDHMVNNGNALVNRPSKVRQGRNVAVCLPSPTPILGTAPAGRFAAFAGTAAARDDLASGVTGVTPTSRWCAQLTFSRRRENSTWPATHLSPCRIFTFWGAAQKP